jgi:siroheme synthase-like protein
VSLFPIFVKLAGRLVIVVGGGKIAEGKIPGLLSASACVRVIAPVATVAIRNWSNHRRLEWYAKAFQASDLDGAALVVAATSASGVNEAVYRAADAKGVLCNAVDDTGHCHFYYGSVVQRGDLQIAISTNGKSPALAQRLRLELEMQFGPEYELWLEWLGTAREALRASDNSPEAKKSALHLLARRSAFEKFKREARCPRPLKGAA